MQTRRGFQFPSLPITDAGGQALVDNFTELGNRLPKTNYLATTDPTINDDQTHDYWPGSQWHNLSSGIFWKCFDSTAGAAIWKQINSATSNDTILSILTAHIAATGAVHGAAVSADNDSIALRNGIGRSDFYQIGGLHDLFFGTDAFVTIGDGGVFSISNSTTTLFSVNDDDNTITFEPTFPITGNGSGLTNIDASQISSLGSAALLNADNSANNIPLLNSSGLLATSILPPLSISNVFVVASQSAMLALSAQEGDVAVRTDSNKTYILSTSSPGTLADWKEIIASGAVTSVNGLSGTVVLTSSQVSEGTNLYFTDARAFIVGEIRQFAIATPAKWLLCN